MSKNPKRPFLIVLEDFVEASEELNFTVSKLVKLNNELQNHEDHYNQEHQH